MNTSTINYLRSLVSEIPALNEKMDRCLETWGAETPPDTVLFAAVGDAIAENVLVFPGEVRRRVFETIEKGMVCPDMAIRSAVATGLVEALVSNADRRPELWAHFQSLFGIASKEHAAAWRNFGR